MPHRSTLARSTANGKVRTIVTGPGPGSRTATSAAFSTPLTDTRTTLPGSRRGVAVVGAAVNREAPGDAALGVGVPSPGVALGPQAEKRTINAKAVPLTLVIVADFEVSVMRVAPGELLRLGRIARQRVPAADERVVLVDHRDVAVVDRGGNAAWVLRFDHMDLRTQGIQLRLQRKALCDAWVRRGRREVGEAERDHLTVAEAIGAAEHGTEAHAGDRVGHEPVLIDAVQTGTRQLRRPVSGVVRIRPIAAPDVTELVQSDSDVVLDRAHSKHLVRYVDDDVLRIVRGIAPMDGGAPRRDDEHRDVRGSVVDDQRAEPARRRLPFRCQRRLDLRER